MDTTTAEPQAPASDCFEPQSCTGSRYQAEPERGALRRPVHDRMLSGGLRLAQAACVVGLAYAAISVYWALGGTWLLDTVAGTLEQQGRAGNPGIVLAVCAAAGLKIIGALLPLAAAGVTPGRAASARRRQMRVLAWLEAAILTIYGLVLTGAGLLVQSGVIASPASADHRALAWHAYLWDPWFLLWGVLVAAALLRSRQRRTARIAPSRSRWLPTARSHAGSIWPAHAAAGSGGPRPARSGQQCVGRWQPRAVR